MQTTVRRYVSNDKRPALLVPAIWAAGLLAVAIAGAPGRSADALFDRLALLFPAAFEPNMLTGVMLFSIPVVMVTAILLSAYAGRD